MGRRGEEEGKKRGSFHSNLDQLLSICGETCSWRHLRLLGLCRPLVAGVSSSSTTTNQALLCKAYVTGKGGLCAGLGAVCPHWSGGVHVPTSPLRHACLTLTLSHTDRHTHTHTHTLNQREGTAEGALGRLFRSRSRSRSCSRSRSLCLSVCTFLSKCLSFLHTDLSPSLFLSVHVPLSHAPLSVPFN